MALTTHASSGRPLGRRRPRAMAMRVLAAAVLVALVDLGVHAQPQTVSKTGSIAGLEAKFADVKGVRTRYYEAGQGEPMVLVHGEGWSGHSSANTWSKNIPGLSKRFHVFAVDKLAAGMTGNPLDDKDYNIQGEVEHMYQSLGLSAESRETIVTFCGSGYRAAHTYVALRLLGYPRIRNYIGSWKEWGDREELPIEMPRQP